MKFGYLGVGALSTPMIANMLQDGHEVVIWNRTREKSQTLSSNGAVVVDQDIEVIDAGGVVVSCLADDAALASIFDDGRLFEKLGDGGMHVSMSTCSPAMTKHLADLAAEHKVEHLTCPVLGRPDFVQRRGHRYALSGKRENFERFEPVLKPLCQELFYLGDKVEAASVAKLCTNFLIASAVESISESLSLAVGSGIDADAIRQMWNQTYFPGVIYEKYSKQILDQEFDPLFTLRLMMKDIGLFQDAANEAKIDVPIATQLAGRLQSAKNAGHADLDFTAVAKLALEQAQR